MKSLPAAVGSSKRIRRMVDELMAACTESLADELKLGIVVDCYKPSEGTPNYAEDTLNGHLIEVLEANKIARVLQSYSHIKLDYLPSNDFMFATQLECTILDRRKLTDLAGKLRAIQETSQPAAINVATGELKVMGLMVQFHLNTNMYELLRLILRDRESRYYDHLPNALRDQLGTPDNLTDVDSFVRNTANNVNKRVRVATGGKVDRFLIVTSKSIQLNPSFR